METIHAYFSRFMMDIRVLARSIPLLYIALFNDKIAMNDPWLIGLLTFNILALLTIFLLRKHEIKLLMIASSLLFLAFLTLPLNNFAIKHWKLFAKRNYFDTYGIFIFAVWSVPFILNSLLACILATWRLYSTAVTIEKAAESSESHEEEERSLPEEPQSPLKKSKRAEL